MTSADVGTWPWRTRWGEVMGIATAGAATGGALLRPSAVGAIMRVRSCMLGLGAHDYSEEKERTSAEAVASVWRGGETYGEEGRKLGKRAASALKAMRLAVGAAANGPASEYHAAVEQATQTVTAMRSDGGDVPAAERWLRARAVLSGALPRPSAADYGASEAAARRADGDGDGDAAENEQEGVRTRVARRVAKAAREASTAVVEAAALWRAEHRPEWHGAAPRARTTTTTRTTTRRATA